MSAIGILEKLNGELQKDIHNECQVVYILSRIRKCLEIKNQQGKYKYLNFYCNWAMHTKINRTRQVAVVLIDFINGTDDGKFERFKHFIDDLRLFIADNSLSEKVFEKDNYLRFVNLLVEIYSDTPVTVTDSNGRKRTITITEPTRPLTYPTVFEIGYKIV